MRLSALLLSTLSPPIFVLGCHDVNENQECVKLTNPRFNDGTYATNYNGKPEFAIDGDFYTDAWGAYWGTSNFLVDITKSLKLGGSLKEPCKVKQVTIFPMRNSQHIWDWNKKMKVRILDKNNWSKKECRPADTFTSKNIQKYNYQNLGMSFFCDEVAGQTVEVSTSSGHVIVSEIQTYCKIQKRKGVELHNPRFANWNYYHAHGPFNTALKPQYAIDGVKGDYFAHSSAAGIAFSADLRNICKVTKVVVYPRRDCCFSRYANMKVYIRSNYMSFAYKECTPTATFNANYVESNKDTGLTWTCTSDWDDKHQSVKIENPGEYTQITELEVYCGR